MDQNILYAVVIVYNTEVNNSLSCVNLRKIRNHKIRIIVVDNSTETNDNEKQCQNLEWTYISMNGNAGLSKAYNRVLDTLRGNDGVVVWFDDDTNITQEYFDCLEAALNKYGDCSIFAPMIQGQDGRFWSPNEYRYLKNKQLRSPEQEIPNDRFNAINSCTAVRLAVYENYRYNEALFLDQVDHAFFEDQRNLHRKFKKLDVIIHHHFSIKGKMESIDALKARYKILIPDFLIFCNKGRGRYILGWIKIIGWGIREGIKYKEPSFLFWCIGEAVNASQR